MLCLSLIGCTQILSKADPCPCLDAGPSASEDASDVVIGKRKRKMIDYKVGLAGCQQVTVTACCIFILSFHYKSQSALLLGSKASFWHAHTVEYCTVGFCVSVIVIFLFNMR